MASFSSFLGFFLYLPCVTSMPDLFSGVLLPTPLRFFIPGLVAPENGLCKSTTPVNNKECMLNNMTDLITTQSVYTRMHVEALYDLADNYGRPPTAPVGAVPVGVTTKTKLALCYVATSVCKCKLLKDWCKKTVSLNELTRSDKKICVPSNAAHPRSVECKSDDGGSDSYSHSESQEKADEYCKNLVNEAPVCKDMSYARFWYRKGKGVGEKRWRCYRYLEENEEKSKMPNACMGDDGKKYKCETPVNTSGYDFCTRHKEIRRIFGIKDQ